MSVSISQVSFEHHRSALGIAEAEPRISWRFSGDASDWEQNGYEIEITRTGDSTKAFRSNSSESVYVPWPDSPLEEAESAAVRIRAHGQSSTPWSDWVSVETGLSKDSWAGIQPITSAREIDSNKPKQPVYFRKDFSVPTGVKSARLYITALGIYEAEINGRRVGDAVLAPGWQSYHHRHVYDTYDVTDLLKTGRNAIGALVGEGWYSGRLGFGGGNWNVYGNYSGLLAQLTVKLENGTSIKVPTDDSWQSGVGPIKTSEIYDGEEYDARYQSDIQGWSTGDFDSSSWHKTRLLPSLKGELVPPDQPPIRSIQQVKPKEFLKSPSGKTIVDFGQNLVGWLRLKVDGPANTTITLHHAEVLQDGELAIRPLRKAKARDIIHLSGKGPLEWEPKFTFHGFRYAQIDGWPDETPLDESSVTAVVLHTDLEQTGWFNSSHELLNKFHSNVRWSMKGNFLGIPTDCPQRDERLGWTGDAHAFGPTSNFLYNTAGFWKSWHKDVWSEMSINDSMVPPYYVPILPSRASTPVSVWGDVVVGNPWNLYQAFGDKVLLGEHLPQARGWIDKGIKRNEDGLWDRSTFQYADWLDPDAPADEPGDAKTDKHLVSDAYLVRMTEILTSIAEVLKEAELVDKYATQHASLKTEFQKAWISGGELANRTQTAYALAIRFDLLSSEDKEKAASTLRKLVEENNYLVSTGFAGTHPLGFALQSINATSDFYRMLLQTKVPSWLYQVVMGGTTTWERWDSLYSNGSLNAGEMTSFNHYAFGSVADWIHRVIGGIAPAEPGYKTIRIAPVPGGDISHASAKFISSYGEIETKWKVDGDGFHLDVKVPPNSKAEVILPGTSKTETVGSGLHEFHDPDYELD